MLRNCSTNDSLLQNNILISEYTIPDTENFKDIRFFQLKDVDGLVIVVDGSDTSKLIKTKPLINSFLNNAGLEGIPLLVLINKFDQGEVNLQIILDDLGINDIINTRFRVIFSLTVNN